MVAGCCVKLKYSLPFDDDGRLAVTGPRACPPVAEERSVRVFCAAFEKPPPSSRVLLARRRSRVRVTVRLPCRERVRARWRSEGDDAAVYLGRPCASVQAYDSYEAAHMDQSLERRDVVRFSPFWVGIKKVEITL